MYMSLSTPKHLVTSDAEAPIEDQPIPIDASPTALSSGYIADSDLKEDPEANPEEDPVDYPADGEDDDDDKSFDDDDDDDDDVEEDEEEEKHHLAPVDSSDVPATDLVSSTKDTEAFETDESAPTPPSPDLAGLGYLSDPKHLCQLLLRHSLPQFLLHYVHHHYHHLHFLHYHLHYPRFSQHHYMYYLHHYLYHYHPPILALLMLRHR
ncbi:hypothetical protein Tco_0076869 [Tanacetum coccineum]